ncbi:aldo/keto reductase [Deltaproteobacteria bacterium Smac51]|nr:aldo/keto reductase [Deltaproteobacteria bacterium Smac51]
MDSRLLGDNFKVSALSYGAMGLSEFYGPALPEADALAVLGRVVELGATMIDTADMYGRGQNEELIGRFLKSRRAGAETGELNIATKFGLERSVNDSYKRRINNSPEYIRRACEASLKRLGVERIDLYYAHRLDPAADLSETISTLAALVREGKIGHIGLCEVSAATLRAAQAIHPIAAVQSEYSLWTREPESSILPVCRELGVGFVAYSPLGRGFLSGRLKNVEELASNDFRRSNPRFQDDNLKRNLDLLPELEAVARELAATPAQTALAWLLGRDARLAAIPGTRNLTRLEENMGAAGLVLSDEQNSRLEKAFRPESILGERYTPEGMKGLGV